MKLDMATVCGRCLSLDYDFIGEYGMVKLVKTEPWIPGGGKLPPS